MGAFLSTNGGTNWTQVKISNENGSSASAAAIAPSSVNTIYVAGYTSSWTPLLFRSSDNGANWTPIANPSASSPIKALAVHPTSPNTLIAVLYWGGAFKSTDGGKSWTRLDKAPSNGECIAWNPSNPKEIFIGDASFSYSADGGATWTDLSSGLAVTNVTQIQIDGPGRIVYIGTEGGGIYRRSF